MKIARIREPDGRCGWALMEPDAGRVRRIRGAFSGWAARVTVDGVDALDLDPEGIDPAMVQLLAPVDPSARVFGVGLNYLTHLTRLGRKEAPPHSIAYIKPDTALVDPDGEIQYPAVTAQLDYEIELVAVVARPLDDEADATACLLGYTIGNDISARDAGKALGSLDLFTQKALDRTAPIGPWIATLAAFGGPGQPQRSMTLRINGEVRQHDNTRNMIFPLAELLNFVDARVALRPGDLLFTGSTCGVGLEDGRFLRPGDRIEAEIEGIGVLRNSVGPQRILSPNRRNGRLGLP